MKKKSVLYLIFAASLSCIFATCRNSAVEETTVVTADTIPFELPDIEDPLPEPEPPAIPPRISLSPKSTFSFKRMANPYPRNYFRNPFDSAIYVSGTFCELRGNHFHAGLDIRTGGVEGWKVLAVADGFVSRVKVSTTGYGRVVYIQHPNGYTSVYGHLKEFKGALANLVKEAQYKQRKFEIELFPKAGQIKLSKGQNFALSGNTGGSGGPHLHFEIRNRKGQSTNPLLYGLDVKDNLKPVIKTIAIYQKDKTSLEQNGGYGNKLIPRNSEYIKGYKTVNLNPGKYSFGMRYDDYFTDRRNVLGVNYCWVTANGKLLYQYQIQDFTFAQGRYIYTHTDPYLKHKTGKTYVRLFKEGFNPLPYYKQVQNGEINLQQNDSVQVKLFIQDYAGLTDSVSWIVVGDTSATDLTIAGKSFTSEHKIPSSGTTIKEGRWKITLPGRAVYHPFMLKYQELARRPNMLSNSSQIHYSYTPLHTYITMNYTVTDEMKAYGDKLCAVSFEGKRIYYEGGKLNGNTLQFRTRSFGEYAITYDNQPPKITPLKVGKKFSFKVTDNLSKVDRIICSLDDKWILAEYEPKRNHIWGEIPNWIKAGDHDFKLIVIDGKGNRAEYKKKISLP